jgi:predicted transport protein
MSDIKLFHTNSNGVSELASSAVQIEASLQALFEKNLEALLGVRFLAREHSTGPVHGGRIDTLGLDEDGSPVIIEYKRNLNENVINQGLFYLDWLMDHRGDFAMIVQRELGHEAANGIDWSGPRLLCIAGDFTRYDEHAVKQIARNIELIRYRRFGDGLLMIEMVHNPREAQTRRARPILQPENSSAVREESSSADQQIDQRPIEANLENEAYTSQHIAYRISQTRGELKDLFEAAHQMLQSMGDDVQVKPQKFYIAFKRIKNFACLEVYPQREVVLIHVKVDPDTVTLEPGFSRDVRSIGHFGTGDLQLSLQTMDDLQKAQSLIQRSYEQS